MRTSLGVLLGRLQPSLIPLTLVACSSSENSHDVAESAGETATRLSEVTVAEQEPPVHFWIGDLGDGPYTTAPAPTVRDDLPEFIKRKRDAQAGATTVDAIDRSVHALDELTRTPPSEVVSLTIDLTDIPQRPWLFREAKDDDERNAYIAEREAMLEPIRSPVRAWLLAHGATDIEEFWATNQMRAKIIASHAAEVLSVDGVVGISLPAPTIEGAVYDGKTCREGTLLAEMIADGFAGLDGNRVNDTAPIRIGVFESGMVNYQHVGWKDCGFPWCSSRLVARKDCSVFPCTASTAPPEGAHATLVTYVAAGSIEQSQDPTYPGWGTDDQVARSGHLPESRIYFYTGMDSDPIQRAILQSITDGVDVLNLSLGYGCPCDSACNVSGINVALGIAREMGVLVSACGGNSGHSSGCTVWYPGLRTESLAVNGLNSYSTYADYNALNILNGASRGGLTYRLFFGTTATTPAIDLTAPGALRLFASHTGTTGYDQTGAEGCSIATPVVSAAAGALRQAFKDMGAPTDSANLLLVNMLLMGDSWDANTWQDRSTRLSNLSGAGRIHMHEYFGLTPPAGWGMHSFSISHGQTVSFPVGDSGSESASILQWKWAATWFEPDMQNAANLDFTVYDTCPQGGGEQLVASDTSYDLRARFTLQQASISNRCLEMRVHGTNVPASGRVVHMADYFHSGDPSDH